MRTDDWPAVKAIYEQGIATRQATFETAGAGLGGAGTPGHLAEPRLVAERDGEVVALGGALADVAPARATRASSRTSIYVDETARGQGVGRTLLGELLAQADAAGIWTVQTSIFPENVASVALHEACGFRVVGSARADRADSTASGGTPC